MSANIHLYQPRSARTGRGESSHAPPDTNFAFAHSTKSSIVDGHAAVRPTKRRSIKADSWASKVKEKQSIQNHDNKDASTRDPNASSKRAINAKRTGAWIRKGRFDERQRQRRVEPDTTTASERSQSRA
ncbi:hypothetical protein EW146_g1938 [Bondarzewia mesenterica]|uniref:Uncharacterized protein n=1 Tax=Bondarzewia mesenterica TaxID=1095465 RepID=A0A4S4M4I6_9AGAM|nr:hypothetical protein EW146_g1938 [Bondarzewia mesenterica]